MKNNLAYPAALLLFGLLFGFAFTYFLQVPWKSWMTITLYCVSLCWVLMAARSRLERLLPRTRLEWLTAGFALLILLSFTLHHSRHVWLSGYLRYFPFLVVLPFLCGKLMRPVDVNRLSKIIIYAGLALLPLLLLDLLFSARQLGQRWTFFGQDHSPLLVGGLLATALLAQGVRRAGSHGSDKKSQLFEYGLMVLLATALVWVSARGWLLSSMVALLVMAVITYKSRKLCVEYSRQFVLVLVTVILSLSFLPRPSSQFYAGLLTPPPQVAVAEGGGGEAGGVMEEATGVLGVTHHWEPILGDESCRPIIDGINSIAIRWTLYREAWEIFRLDPLAGVGAGNFGLYSCSGIMGFPHSTVLQAFSELGLLGGVLLLAIAFLMAREFLRDVSEPRAPEILNARQLVIALFAAYFLADQIYGNYFMSSGTYLLIGMFANLHVNRQS
ncbi:O-antigen ligase family protein [Ferriphaselus sp. R-1]|uniref:O-antigen ligase family protein n=1 Tax=Ferriphaselus sp. R-1 TaxID=1485544 RepID=UPI00054DD28E|nr:O-antigen ligase family protein [Ferriphaselus sp. R-1]